MLMFLQLLLAQNLRTSMGLQDLLQDLHIEMQFMWSLFVWIMSSGVLLRDHRRL